MTAVLPQPAGAPERLDLGVYVHFPWCLQKCPYCDFLSVPAARPAIPHARYADAVLAELDRRHGEVAPDARLRSVFFGGGTPSLWEPSELGRVLADVTRRLGRTAELEVTVECNPSSLDYERARALRDVGVTRLSIGVQSLDARRLSFLGRLHDAEGGLAAVRAALRAGFDHVSADLIFGVAGQTPLEARREVATVADLGVDHLSAYALTIEAGTRFGELERRGRLPLLDEALVAESFQAVEDALSERGFDHYEISNYGKRGERAEHNVGYWRGRDYLGLGTGAWGTWTTRAGRFRYRNVQAPERYLEGWLRDGARELDRPGELVAELEPITPEIAVRERLLLGLRLEEGVDLRELSLSTGVDARSRARLRSIERLAERGRLSVEGERIRIPREQWLFADGIIAELL